MEWSGEAGMTKDDSPLKCFNLHVFGYLFVAEYAWDASRPGGSDHQNQPKKGPFSIVDYCRHILQPGTYMDSISLIALSFEFGIKITVIDALQLREVRIRHDNKLEQVDVVLVHNSRTHYSSASTYDTNQYINTRINR